MNKFDLITWARKLHKYKYTYYGKECTASRMVIRCPIHGKFELPVREHTYQNKGCSHCEADVSCTFDHFMKLVRAKFKGRYRYFKPLNFSQHGLIKFKCIHHGDVTQMVYAHLNSRGEGCVHCSRGEMSRDQFIERARNKHGSRKYSYRDTPKGLISGKVKIHCKAHGAFNIDAASHVNGGGCRSCNYKMKYFYLYLFKVWKGKKRFFKLGIADDVNRRTKELARGLATGYKIELIKAFKLDTKYAVFKAESFILSSVEGNHVSKRIMSDGYMETKDNGFTPEKMLSLVTRLLREYKKDYFEYAPEVQLYAASLSGKERMKKKRDKRNERRRTVEQHYRQTRGL